LRSYEVNVLAIVSKVNNFIRTSDTPFRTFHVLRNIETGIQTTFRKYNVHSFGIGGTQIPGLRMYNWLLILQIFVVKCSWVKCGEVQRCVAVYWWS